MIKKKFRKLTWTLYRPNGTVTTRLSGANLRISSSSSSSNSNNRNPAMSSGSQPRDLDFPALGRSVGNLAGQSATALLSSQPQPQQQQHSWTKITCVKPAAMPKAKKVAPAPQLGPALNSGDDFPSLAKGSTTTVKPPSATWVQVKFENNIHCVYNKDLITTQIMYKTIIISSIKRYFVGPIRKLKPRFVNNDGRNKRQSQKKKDETATTDN